MMQWILAGFFALSTYGVWGQECGVKEYWTESCTACPGNWYANCGGYTQVGERGCGFLNAGCQIHCRKDFGICPRDCSVHEWKDWEPCTEQCSDGGRAMAAGTRTRRREVN